MKKEDYEKKILKEKAKLWGSRVGFWGILFFLIGSLVALGGYGLHTEYIYNEEVGSHIDMAHDAVTPEIVIEQIDLAEQGMRNLGLTEEMDSKWFDWEKLPIYRTDWLYEKLDMIRDRATDVIDWRENTRDDYNNTEQFSDVYQKKLTSIKEIINDEFDEVAFGAFILNHHTWLYWSIGMGSILSLGIGLYCVFGGCIFVFELNDDIKSSIRSYRREIKYLENPDRYHDSDW